MHVCTCMSPLLVRDVHEAAGHRSQLDGSRAGHVGAGDGDGRELATSDRVKDPLRYHHVPLRRRKLKDSTELGHVPIRETEAERVGQMARAVPRVHGVHHALERLSGQEHLVAAAVAKAVVEAGRDAQQSRRPHALHALRWARSLTEGGGGQGRCGRRAAVVVIIVIVVFGSGGRAKGRKGGATAKVHSRRGRGRSKGERVWRRPRSGWRRRGKRERACRRRWRGGEVETTRLGSWG